MASHIEDIRFSIRQNPKTGKWYVIGPCGAGYWMPISNPHDCKSDAIKDLHHLKQAELHRNDSLASI